MREQNDNMLFMEKERQQEQRKMFEVDIESRQKTYKSIYENLKVTKLANGASSLRRLEIRFLPLDPLLVSYIFKALRHNFALQELILTDDCLQYCGLDVFKELFNALQHNEHCGLTLLDLSRNIHTFDEDEEVHQALIDALSR